MRVLCLHGMGTNAAIFRAQTASFRSLLPSYWEFEFFDAECDWKAATGIGEIYPGPYLCWYPTPCPMEKVQDAVELVQEFIEEEGPFDAVMGFSQGAALAATVLLHHQLEKPLEPPPFRVAFFICGSLPFSLNCGSGVDVTRLFAVGNDPYTGDIELWRKFEAEDDCIMLPSTPKRPQMQLPSVDSSDSISSIQSYQSSEASQDSGYHSGASTPELTTSNSHTSLASPLSTPSESTRDLGTFLKGRTRRFHPANDDIRITIPTAHIWGKQDSYYSQGIELSKLCQEDLVSSFDHGAGHEIPMKAAVSKAIKDAIEQAVERSEILY